MRKRRNENGKLLLCVLVAFLSFALLGGVQAEAAKKMSKKDFKATGKDAKAMNNDFIKKCKKEGYYPSESGWAVYYFGYGKDDTKKTVLTTNRNIKPHFSTLKDVEKKYGKKEDWNSGKWNAKTKKADALYQMSLKQKKSTAKAYKNAKQYVEYIFCDDVGMGWKVKDKEGLSGNRYPLFHLRFYFDKNGKVELIEYRMQIDTDWG